MMQKNGKFLSTGGRIYGLLIWAYVKVMCMGKNIRCSLKCFEQCRTTGFQFMPQAVTVYGIFWKTVCSTNSLSTRDEKAEFANNIDFDEVAHNEPPHLDLHCLLSSV